MGVSTSVRYRSYRCLAYSVFVFCTAALLSSPEEGRADVTARECILLAPAVEAGGAWRLPPDAAWHTLGSLAYNFAADSDHVITGTVFLTEGNSPGAGVEYQFLLDGVAHGWFLRRIPRNFPTSQTIRVFVGDVSGGEHTIVLRARNISSSYVYYHGLWITPLLVEDWETTAVTGTSSSSVVGSSYSTLLSLTTNNAASTFNYLGAFVKVIGGTSGAQMDYRFVRNGVELYRFTDSVYDVLGNGINFAFIDSTPAVGGNTILLQARSPSGSSVTVGARELAVQSLPAVGLFQASTTGPHFIQNDAQWHIVSSSGWIGLPAASIGLWGTDGSGFAHLVYAGALNSEAEARFFLSLQQSGQTFEVGWIGLHPTGRTKLEALPSDWEQLGLNTVGQFKMDLQVRGMCSGANPDIRLARTQFQILVTPDDTRYTGASCAVNSSVCCANVPECTVYECSAGDLPQVSVGPWDCY